MVIRDSNDENIRAEISRELRETNGRASLAKNNGSGLASPLDRFSSAVIDYIIVLMPFIYLAISPFQREIKAAAMVEDHWRVTFAIAMAALTIFALIFLYQTFCVWIWGATLGKAMMGLRVKSVWRGERITFFQATVRAGLWWASWLGLGVPFLAMSSNLKRRPLHDRAADTIVLAVAPGRAIAAPGRQESALVTAIYSAFGLCLAALLGVQAFVWVYEGQTQAQLIRSLEDENILCREVSEAQAAWPERPESEGVAAAFDGSFGETPRLEVALTLYAANVIDRKCLQSEVEALFAGDAQFPALYLARSFVYADQMALSNLYLDKVCELDAKSADCMLTKIITSADPASWDANIALLREWKSAELPAYVGLWGAQYLLRREDFQLASDLLARVPNMPQLSDFTVSARTKILWGLGRHEESSGSETAAYSVLRDDVKLELASFMCFERIANDCAAAQDMSCKTMGTLVEELDDSLSSLKASLASLRKWECEQPVKAGGEKDYAALLSWPLHPDVRALTAALAKNGIEGFIELAGDSSLDSELLDEITRRIVDRTSSERTLDQIMSDWTRSRRTLSWKRLGAALFAKRYEREEYEQTVDIAEEMVREGGAVPQTLLEEAVIAAVRSGHNLRAKTLLARYSEVYPVPQAGLTRAAERVPASAAASWSASGLESPAAVAAREARRALAGEFLSAVQKLRAGER